MKRELQEKLFKEFPLLYQDRTKSMMETCMCWGIECGKGWYDILYNLSSKLEPLIQKFYDENPNVRCAACGCARDKHYASATKNPKKCLAVKKYSTKHVKMRWKYSKNKVLNYLYQLRSTALRKINGFLSLFFYEYSVCFCEQYNPLIPRASQVKEKYGSLRFYMTCATNEMSDLIYQAEEESENTCETCGALGKPNEHG